MADLLQQQRDFGERHAQDDALHEYYKQMGDLMTVHNLMGPKNEDDSKRLLARAQTMTLLERLGSESDRAKRKKRELVPFLSDAGLIHKDNTIVILSGADLRSVNLSGADLRDAMLNGADLRGAILGEANLYGAHVTDEQLSTCRSLWRAPMTDGQKYEDRLKDKQRRGKDGSSTDSS